MFRCASASPYHNCQPWLWTNQVAAAPHPASSTVTSTTAIQPFEAVRAFTATRPGRLEVRAGFEFLVAGIDLRACERSETVHAEFLAAETSHDGSVDDGAAQFRHVDLPVL